MRYVIFSRVSTNMQDTENQLFEIDQYLKSVKKEGDKVIRFDEKVKTTRDEMEDRPILLEMLETLERGDVLIVYKLSRLARGHELALVYHIITKKKKAEVVSLYEKELNDEIIHAYAMVGAFERKNISDNTKTALKNKQFKMEKVGQIWYGFTLDPNVLNTKERARTFDKPYKLIPDDYEQSVIAIAKELRADGYSLNEIANQLNERGLVNRSGNPFQKMTVQRVLHREETRFQAPTALELALSH